VATFWDTILRKPVSADSEVNQSAMPGRFLRKSGFQWLELLIGVLIALVAAIITVVRVSDLSVYSADNTHKRAELHRAIMHNDPPGDGTWGDSGANNINVRVAVVWVAEHLSRMTGKSTDFIYRAIDLAALFAALLGIQALLKRWFSPVEAILGLLLFCMLLPLTALDHYFHPWDRPMLFLWAAMILTLVNRRVALFAILLTVSVIVKFDSIFAVGMILFLYARTDKWRYATGTTLLVAAVGAMPLAALLILYPGGQEPIDVFQQVSRNISVAAELGIAYPPLLTHGLLSALGIAGWKRGTIPMRRLWVFGLILLIPHILVTNFLEVRAQIGTMLCMLPLALQGVLSISELAGPRADRAAGGA
jgi:hypothetical protein